MSSNDHLDEAGCWELLARFPHGNLCGTTAEGLPVMRTLNHAILDGGIYFHGAATGEKRGMLGRRAVFGCEEVVAQIPSYWRDPVSACPATTWYQSAQAHGVLEPVDDMSVKARALSALMHRMQPEGGHKPIHEDDAVYTKMLRATTVFRLVPERMTGRNKIGRAKKTEDITPILRGMWGRGTVQDLRGIETILAQNERAHRIPELCGPGGTEFVVFPTEEIAREAAALLHGQYWNGGYADAQLVSGVLGASAWIGARESTSGRLVGTAAASSDGVKQAYIFDVAVDPDFQGVGLGTALMKVLLGHALLRDVRKVVLRTKDAQEFYRNFEFEERGSPADSDGIVTMVRPRPLQG